jgi:hypothetical protein
MSQAFRPGLRGRVTADYRAVYPDPIELLPGDILMVGERDTEWPAFVWCTGPDGRVGWVPDNCIIRTGVGQGVARQAYSARELTATNGEIVGLEHEEGGWYWVVNGRGELGWLPASHVVLLADA